MDGAAPCICAGTHLLADNGLIHEEMLQLFGEVFAGRYRYPMPQIQVTN